MLYRVGRLILASLVVSAVTMALLEVSLRIAPGILPAPILVRFNDVLREKIAADRGFMTQNLTYVFDRDDNGPELRIPLPNVTFTYPDIFSFDQDVGAVLSTTMDEVGFCNPTNLYSSVEAFDIVTIGDSLTWCHTVDAADTFSFLLGQQIDRSVLNLGKGGVGLFEYVQILKGFGVQKEPKIVVMNVYEGNDLRDAVEYWQAVDEARTDNEIEDSVPAVIKLRDRLRNSFVGEKSYSINLVLATASFGYSILAYPEEREQRSIDFSYDVPLTDKVVTFNSMNLDVDEVVYARQIFDKEIGVEMFTPALASFVELAQLHQFEPVVTYIPSAHTAYAETVQFSDPLLEELLNEFSLSMREYFQTTGQRMGFEFIDFTEDMQTAARESSSNELLYFPTNLHLTRTGHEVISNRLAKQFDSSQ